MATKTKQFDVSKESVIQFSKGLATIIPDGTSVMINKVNYAKADLIAKFKACESLFDAEEATTLAATQAKNARIHGSADIETFANALAPMVVAMVGADEAAQCGIELGKEKAELSTEAKSERVAKMLATREARGTKGKKQKLAIKGVVPPPAATTGNSGTDTNH